MTSPADLLRDYIQRTVAHLPDDLQELADEIGEVVRYPAAESWELKGPSDTWAFLSDVGLPKSCPTMIELDANAQDLGDFVRIGCTNYGDPVCIEKASGAVVYLEHDGDQRRHQINTSPLTFLGSICAYDKRALQTTRETIRALDPDAIAEGQWWHNAISS
ncbi:MAG: SUKH-4 family immunity protein [Akkermansiaceae bacterium]|nr:SUKH-4 family immunity protein [Akkermansiaceae bacterium]